MRLRGRLVLLLPLGVGAMGVVRMYTLYVYIESSAPYKTRSQCLRGGSGVGGAFNRIVTASNARQINIYVLYTPSLKLARALTRVLMDIPRLRAAPARKFVRHASRKL